MRMHFVTQCLLLSTILTIETSADPTSATTSTESSPVTSSSTDTSSSTESSPDTSSSTTSTESTVPSSSSTDSSPDTSSSTTSTESSPVTSSSTKTSTDTSSSTTSTESPPVTSSSTKTTTDTSSSTTSTESTAVASSSIKTTESSPDTSSSTTNTPTTLITMSPTLSTPNKDDIDSEKLNVQIELILYTSRTGHTIGNTEFDHQTAILRHAASLDSDFLHVKRQAYYKFLSYNSLRLKLEADLQSRIAVTENYLQTEKIGDKCRAFYQNQKWELRRALNEPNFLKSHKLRLHSENCPHKQTTDSEETEEDDDFCLFCTDWFSLKK